MSDPHTYTIGWICAVVVELVAAKAMFDEKHEDLENSPEHDNNTYLLGRIGQHNVVVAILPHGEYGLVNAANAARDLMRTFPNIRVGLMVGIAGGAPSQENDIRLGDVVVSAPYAGTGGVFQYDYGKSVQDEPLIVTKHTNKPAQCLLAAVAALRAEYTLEGHNLESVINDAFEKFPRLRKSGYNKPEISTDKLFVSSYRHDVKQNSDCTTSCEDVSKLIVRPERGEDEDSPMIHYGLIASANQLMKDANIRDQLSAERGILCFEMEAAGLIDHFPSIVVRGICDYADTHKNKRWQGYAAMTAAAYAKDLLLKLAPKKVQAEGKMLDALSDCMLIKTRTGCAQKQNKTKTLYSGNSNNKPRYEDKCCVRQIRRSGTLCQNFEMARTARSFHELQ